MRNQMQAEVEDLKSMQRHPSLPVPMPPEKDSDDYEDFDDGEMLSTLWQDGAEKFEDELMAMEDY